jgi:transposase-like protein
LAQRGIEVNRESIRLWCNKFGPRYARRLRRAHRGYGDTFFIDEVFVKIQGKQQYLWRAVDQGGEVIVVFLQARRDGNAARRFFKRVLKRHQDEPRKIVTDKLRSYGVAHRKLTPETDSSSRVRYAPVQIETAGAAISRCPCGGLQPVQSRAKSDSRTPLSRVEAPCLCVLGNGCGRMRQCSRWNSLAKKS